MNSIYRHTQNKLETEFDPVLLNQFLLMVEGWSMGLSMNLIDVTSTLTVTPLAMKNLVSLWDEYLHLWGLEHIPILCKQGFKIEQYWVHHDGYEPLPNLSQLTVIPIGDDMFQFVLFHIHQQ